MPSPDAGKARGAKGRTNRSRVSSAEYVSAIGGVLEALGDICRGRHFDGATAAPLLEAVLEAVEGVGIIRPPAPREHKAVDLYLQQAVEAARGQPTEELARAVAVASPCLYWHGVRDSYPGVAGLDRFREAFAYTQIIGPDWGNIRWPYESKEIIVGLALQGPHVDYLPHHHEAVEFYFVLGGTAMWQKGGGPWVRRPPGSLILHGAHESHAMRTDDEPFLAVFAWFGALESDLHITA